MPRESWQLYGARRLNLRRFCERPVHTRAFARFDTFVLLYLASGELPNFVGKFSHTWRC